ncbi:MAG: hypothetical protein Q9190_006099 [Brigantiaea leucoxantha]
MKNPYAQLGDYVSNVSRFKIIEREGEQFANAFFDLETKKTIARALDDFGVDYCADGRRKAWYAAFAGAGIAADKNLQHVQLA